MADALQSVGLGIALGGVLLVLLSRFPGEPLDLDCDSQGKQQESSDASDVPASMSQAELETRRREVELAASQLKVDKLQQLLGLEKHKIDAMVEQAKRDAIQGRVASAQSLSYARWLDVAFFAVILALIAVVLRVEYSLDALDVVALAFPREADVLRRVLTLPRRLLALWTLE
ncbi:hypothetical protein PINS_up009809 [Pythium insidiosum]|nr:hypothetical protein PINS_up009809 [Pythium insidiosum]